MELTLSQKQHVFPQLITQLIQHCIGLGFEVAFSEAWRSPEEAARLASLHRGVVNSTHTLRLALDLLLYKDGVYLTDSEDYKEAGRFWKSHSSSSGKFTCCWGGDFSKPDGNHFSIEHQGIR